MVIVWDEAKRETNLRTHRLDFADARDLFEWDAAVIVPSYPGPDGRERFVAVGPMGDRPVALAALTTSIDRIPAELPGLVGALAMRGAVFGAHGVAA